MDALEFATPEDHRTTVSADAVAAFENRMRGELIAPGDAAYEESASVWNGMIRKRPALIARCRNTSDVVEAVGFAREHGVRFSTRSVGHNIAGGALCDDGLVVDLSRMRGIRVDPEGGTAWVQPGADWGDFDREAQLYGLATPGGIISTTGVAGLTLGGGFGWLTRRHGFTCDNLISADVVLADGRVVNASEEREPELFWGLRGGGGNFGVVTGFEFRLHPVGPEVVGGIVLHPIERVEEVLEFYREFTGDAPNELGSLAVVRYAPPAPFLPEEVHGNLVVGIVVCYTGPVEEGMRVVAPVKEFGEPLGDVIGPKPYTAVQSMLDAAQPPGRHYYWKSEYMPGLEGGSIECVAEYGRKLSSAQSGILLMHLGGAARRIPDAATAAGNRDAEFVLNIGSSWIPPEPADPHVEYTREFWRAVRPFSTGGTYVNFLTADEDEDRVRTAFGDHYERLSQVKRRYDPENAFRPAQNVRPAVPAGK